MYELHKKLILHRDIKPKNIFISGKTFKIGDFGNSIKISSLEETVNQSGTNGYISPEGMMD